MLALLPAPHSVLAVLPAVDSLCRRMRRRWLPPRTWRRTPSTPSRWWSSQLRAGRTEQASKRRHPPSPRLRWGWWPKTHCITSRPHTGQDWPSESDYCDRAAAPAAHPAAAKPCQWRGYSWALIESAAHRPPSAPAAPPDVSFPSSRKPCNMHLHQPCMAGWV